MRLSAGIEVVATAFLGSGGHPVRHLDRFSQPKSGLDARLVDTTSGRRFYLSPIGHYCKHLGCPAQIACEAMTTAWQCQP